MSPAARVGSTLESFRLPEFRLLFVNGMLAAVSMNVTMLVHSWLVLSLAGDSPLWAGVSVALNGAGQVGFSLVAGVIVDRYERRRVLMAEQLVSGATAATLSATTFFGGASLPLALGFSVLMGATATLQRTASNAVLYDVAGHERLLNATSLRRLAVIPGMVGGSLLVGWLIATVGIWAGYAFIAGALLTAPWVLLGLAPRPPASQHRESVLQQVWEGLRYGATHAQVRTLLLIAVVMESCGFSYMTMMPVMAKTVLDVGAVGAGMLTAASGIGSGIAVFAVAGLGNFDRKPNLILAAAAGSGIGLIGFSLSPTLPVAMAFAFLTTGCLMAYDITLGALLQLVSPPELRGRMVSLHSLAIAFMSLGGFVTGAIGSLIGVPAMMTIGGTAILANLGAQRSRLLRIREA